MVRKTELNVDFISFQLLQNLSYEYFIYIDLISSLLDPKFVDPGSTLIRVSAYGP